MHAGMSYKIKAKGKNQELNILYKYTVFMCMGFISENSLSNDQFVIAAEKVA